MAAGKKPDEKTDSTLKAVQSVYHALRGLTADERGQVIASVRALVEVSPVAATEGGGGGGGSTGGEQTTGPKRKLSIVELVQDKQPKTNAERIALFAYYREHIEGLPQFERDDLRPYSVKARIATPTNYDRDFVTAVTQGWIHEDGAESYLTNSGTEAVESGFNAAAKGVRRAQRRPSERRPADAGAQRDVLRPRHVGVASARDLQPVNCYAGASSR